MKKSSFILGLIVSNIFLFGGEFDGYEENYSFLEPVDMVQTMIDAKNNFSDIVYFSTNKKLAQKNFNVLKNSSMIDAHLADNKTMQCSYRTKSKNIITAFFKKGKNLWYLEKLSNKKHQKLKTNGLQNQYQPYEAEGCFNSFVNSFEQIYPNSQLKTIGRETQVDGILIKKGNRVFNARFNLSYLSLNKVRKSGWYVSKIVLNPSNRKKIKNQKVASNKRGFLLRKVIPHVENARLVTTPNRRGVILDTTPLPHLKKMVCSDHRKDRYIRLAFDLDRDKHIYSLFGVDKANHKLLRFNINSKKAKIVKNNCSFLQVKKGSRLEVNLKNFKSRVLDIVYGDTNSLNKSYMDLSY